MTLNFDVRLQSEDNKHSICIDMAKCEGYFINNKTSLRGGLWFFKDKHGTALDCFNGMVNLPIEVIATLRSNGFYVDSTFIR